MEEQYYSGVINRTQVINFYQENAFLNKWEAEILQMRTDLDYLSGTQAFIGTVEFNTMLTEYKKKQGEDFHLADFHHQILEDGIIPMYQLKQKILLDEY